MGDSYYDVAQICMNGHVITSMSRDYPQHKRANCDQCGASTICHCPNCNTPIQGYYHVSGVIGGFEYDAPRFCHSCGSAMPWVSSKLEAAFEIIDLMDSLDENERSDLKQSVEELVRETAKIALAKVKLKRYLKKVDNDISDGLSEILDGILSEQVRESLK